MTHFRSSALVIWLLEHTGSLLYL